MTLNRTGNADGTLLVSAGNGKARTVQITQITGDGTLSISLAAGTASDIVGNLAPSAGPSRTFVVDNTAPTSSVAGLPPSETTIRFPVTWYGRDDVGGVLAGSGIATYDIYVSDNGGPYQPWQIATRNTAATFAGTVGHTYAFYSLAVDNVGHRQTARLATATTTLVSNMWHNYANPCDVDGSGQVKAADVLHLVNYINRNGNKTTLPTLPLVPPLYYDVASGLDGDGVVTTVDVLTVVNCLNARSRGLAEGEVTRSTGWAPTPDRLEPWPIEEVARGGCCTPLRALLTMSLTASRHASEPTPTPARPKNAFSVQIILNDSRRLDSIPLRPQHPLTSARHIEAIDVWLASLKDIGSDLAADVAGAWRA